MKENMPLSSTFAVYQSRFRVPLTRRRVFFGADRVERRPDYEPKLDIPAVGIRRARERMKD
jgi:hypothetical protein